MVNKTKSLDSQGSSSILVLLIAVVVVASIFFVNGIFTDTNKTPSDLTAYTPIAQNFTDNRVVLQLKTINFGSCGESAVIGFLVDQSGSMDFGSKENNLKNALRIFTNNFPPEGILGLRTYSDNTYSPIVVPFDYYKNNKSQIASAIARMKPYRATHSKTAFEAEKQLLDAARAKYPQYKFNLIFISDGIPESQEGLDRLCPGGNLTSGDPRYCGPHPDNPSKCRCFDPNQDPTQVATEIKASGVRIFTIGYIHDISDVKFQNDLTTLMTNVASKPDDFYFAPIDNQLTEILGGIKTKICKTP